MERRLGIHSNPWESGILQEKNRKRLLELAYTAKHISEIDELGMAKGRKRGARERRDVHR
jgi:hypothetical protein